MLSPRTISLHEPFKVFDVGVAGALLVASQMPKDIQFPSCQKKSLYSIPNRGEQSVEP